MLITSIKPHVFAWDNTDQLEKTVTGKGTSHRINGIAVQAKVYGPFLPTAELPHIEKKSKQRSVCAKIHDLEAYVSGAHVGPQFLLTKNNLDKEFYASMSKKLKLGKQIMLFQAGQDLTFKVGMKNHSLKMQ